MRKLQFYHIKFKNKEEKKVSYVYKNKISKSMIVFKVQKDVLQLDKNDSENDFDMSLDDTVGKDYCISKSVLNMDL